MLCRVFAHDIGDRTVIVFRAVGCEGIPDGYWIPCSECNPAYKIRGFEKYNEASGYLKGYEHPPLFMETARIHVVRRALGLETFGLSKKLTTLLLSLGAFSRLLA